MVTLEDYIRHVEQETAGLAKAVGKIYESQEKFIGGISPIHNPDELPLFTGNRRQIGELMDILGEYRGLKSGDIPNVVYDNAINYYGADRPGRIIGGVEVEDHTPVGLVPHPAPLDITSCGYWTPLVIQFGEQLYEAAFPKVEITNEFMNDISIAKAMAEANYLERLECLENKEIEKPVQPIPQSETKTPNTGRKTRTSRKHEKRKSKEDEGKKIVQNNSTSNTYILPSENPPIHDHSKEYIV
jgi:hypothetical protein